MSILGEEDIERAAQEHIRDEEQARDFTRLVVPSVARRQDPKTLEDLYETYEISTAKNSLRIERTKPEVFRSTRIAGFLCDINTPITMSDFASQFGGGEYKVHVRGLTNSALKGKTDLVVKTLDTIIVKIPGDPILAAGGDDKMTTTVPSTNTQIELKKMELDSKDKDYFKHKAEKLEEEVRRAGSMDAEVLRRMEESAERRAAEARAGIQDAYNRAVNELADMKNDLRAKESVVSDLRNQIVEVQREAERRIATEESRREKDLKERYETELRNLREQFDREQSRLREQHKADTDKMRHDFDMRTHDMSEKHNEERRRLQDEMTTRERTVKETQEARANDLIRTYTERINEMDRSANRQIETLKESYARELEAIRLSESVKSTSTKQTADFQVALLQQENARMSAEISELRRSQTDLLQKLHEDPLTAIQKAKQIVSLTKDDDDDGPAETADNSPFTWQKGLVEVAKSVVPGLISAAAPRLAGAAQPQAGASMPQQLPQQQRRALPQQAQPAPQRRVYRPPAQWAGETMPPAFADSRVPAPPDVPVSVAVPRRPRPVAPQQQAQPAPRPAAPPPPPPSPPPAPASQPAATEPPNIQIPEDKLIYVMGRLDQAISQGQVAAQDLAGELIEAVGAEQLKIIIQSLTPEQLVAVIAMQPGGDKTAMVTLEGRRYLEDLWASVRTKLG